MKKLRLVIADDEAFIRKHLVDLFPWEDMGYTIAASFSNGEKALNYLHTYGADVVLTDIQMPVLDGIGLTRAIREAGLPVSVVLLSAYSDFEYARQAMTYGVLDYIVKPVCYEELVTLFSSLHETLCGPDAGQAQQTDMMARILSYIETHIEDVTLEDVARDAGLSPDYISRLFKKQNRISFADYIHQTRMKQAGVLVHQINKPISEIAEHLGYHNSKNFSRAFHTFYGMTPMEYRKQKKLPPPAHERS